METYFVIDNDENLDQIEGVECFDYTMRDVNDLFV